MIYWNGKQKCSSAKKTASYFVELQDPFFSYHSVVAHADVTTMRISSARFIFVCLLVKCNVPIASPVQYNFSIQQNLKFQHIEKK